MVSREDATNPLVVYITDAEGAMSGSGTLFYGGGNDLFVFTCAHVVDDAERLRLVFLVPLDVERDAYEPYAMEVGREQVYFSPLDKVEECDGRKTHTDDVAIIRVAKPNDLEVGITEYCVVEPRHGERFYAQGFPGGLDDFDAAIDFLECVHGDVLRNRPGGTCFVVRIADNFLDASNRVSELQGLSGGPIWQDADGGSQGSPYALFGLVSEAQGYNAERGRVFAAKAERLRNMMHDRFGVAIARGLPGATIENASCVDATPSSPDVALTRRGGPFESDWLDERTSACRQSINELQLTKAIDVARETIGDARFDTCDHEAQKTLMRYLLYCYEICDLDEEFDALEEDMRRRGLCGDYDVLRKMTRSFGRKDYRETMEVASRCLSEPRDVRSASLTACARVYLALSRSYEEQLTAEETMGGILDDRGTLLQSAGDEEDDALLYQMVGYVYGDRFHDYVRAVRFLERSYRIGYDNVVLESLGAAYYFLGVSAATREDDTVDLASADMRSLYKARECFLEVAEKADGLSWAATMRRVGLCVYNTFALLGDKYRVITLYPDVIKHVGFEDARVARDVEMKHALVMVQSGRVDASIYPHLSRSDRILLRAASTGAGCLREIGCAVTNLTEPQIASSGLEQRVRDAIRAIEGNISLVDKRDRPILCTQLLNLYGRGVSLFGWEKLEKLRYWLNRLRPCADQRLVESMENYVYELENPIEDAVRRYKETYTSRRDAVSWIELCNLYIRHGMLDEADAMYRELISGKKSLFTDGPEFAYRAYIDFVTNYRRDPKDALQAFVDARRGFIDADIESFWELELMFMTNTFNDPERFEEERHSFVERDLLGEEEYHRAAFIAFMANLDREKAAEHERFIEQCPHMVNPVTQRLVARKEEVHFLNWIGAIKPEFLPPYSSMTEAHACDVIASYAGEAWHGRVGASVANRFLTERRFAVDGWGLYLLFRLGAFDELGGADRVYVPHSAVIRLLEELSVTNNENIRTLLDQVRSNGVFEIVSARFESQLEVRNAVEYTEPATTVALALEKDCLAVIGFPELRDDLIAKFGDGMLRVDDACRLLAEGWHGG